MYLIIFRTKYETHSLSTQYKDIFHIAWLLEHDNSTIQFKVCDDFPLTYKDFGFGKFKKWVTQFTYEDEK